MSEIGKGWLLIPILDKLFFYAVWCSCSYLVHLLQLNWKSTQAAVAALLQCDAMLNVGGREEEVLLLFALQRVAVAM